MTTAAQRKGDVDGHPGAASAAEPHVVEEPAGAEVAPDLVMVPLPESKTTGRVTLRAYRKFQTPSRRMFGYHLGSRRHFSGKALHLRVAVDGTRISRKGIMKGLEAEPSNTAAWMAPQAAHGRVNSFRKVTPIDDFTRAGHGSWFLLCHAFPGVT